MLSVSEILASANCSTQGGGRAARGSEVGACAGVMCVPMAVGVDLLRRVRVESGGTPGLSIRSVSFPDKFTTDVAEHTPRFLSFFLSFFF